MSNGSEGNLWRLSTASSTSKFSTLKKLVPTTQRDAMRTFFDRRVPPSQEVLAIGSDGHPQEERKLSWREWAGDKMRSRGMSGSDAAVEKVTLFPGWAARRYHDPGTEGKEAAEFSLEVFVSGFAASYVPPESATRSQRAFMRLAKAYAALPKLPSPTSGQPTSAPFNDVASQRISNSTEDLLKTVRLPPTPSNITEESETAALERQFRKAELDIDSDSLRSAESDSNASSSTNTPPFITPGSSPGVSYATASGQFAASLTDLTRLHANLSARLQPFWSRSLSNRTLRLSLFSSAPRSNSFFPDEETPSDDPAREPIFVQVINTDPQGAFEAHIHVPWERVCVHPGALHVAFGDVDDDAELFVCVELLPPLDPAMPFMTREATTRSVLPVTLSQTEVRLISDIDDTIKLSNILGGARAVFQNVFVKHLEELVIRGMGDWYTRMWSRGVRFHYVSNSPFELLPVINEFIKVSNLPRGSIKLRSYAGRSLFNGLLSAPATRKRTGLVEILNAFNCSRFVLVGDSGEQDLELYAQLAAERHSQILAVFIRDARGPNAQPISDPTGEEIKRQPPPSRSSSYAASLPPFTPTSGTRSHPVTPSVEKTPTLKSYSDPATSSGTQRLSPSYINTTSQDYMSAVVPELSSGTELPPPRRPWVTARAPSDPTPGLGLPSTFFDSGLTIDTTSSPPSSRPASPSSSSSSSITGLRFPGSLTESEIGNLPPAERKRYKLQERVYRARLLMPSHISLRVFNNPEECVEADRILDDLAGRKRPGGNKR